MIFYKIRFDIDLGSRLPWASHNKRKFSVLIPLYFISYLLEYLCTGFTQINWVYHNCVIVFYIHILKRFYSLLIKENFNLKLFPESPFRQFLWYLMIMCVYKDVCRRRVELGQKGKEGVIRTLLSSESISTGKVFPDCEFLKCPLWHLYSSFSSLSYFVYYVKSVYKEKQHYLNFFV